MDNNVINPNQQPETETPQTSTTQGAVFSPVVVPVKQDSNNPLKNKKVLIAAGAGIAVLLLMLVLLLAFRSSGKQPASTENNQTADNSLLEPAKAIDIEQINNAISQDVSGLNDDSQLPANRIDDKNLDL